MAFGWFYECGHLERAMAAGRRCLGAAAAAAAAAQCRPGPWSARSVALVALEMSGDCEGEFSRCPRVSHSLGEAGETNGDGGLQPPGVLASPRRPSRP